LVFKKHMVKRNKELELEALEEMKKDGGSQWVTDEAAEKKMEMAGLEQEKADLDYCIEMSKMQSEEMSKMQGEEDQMMAEAMRLSEQDFKNEQIEFERQMEEVKKMSALEITEIKAPAPEPEQPKPTPKATEPKIAEKPAPAPASKMPDVTPTKVEEPAELHPMLAKIEAERRIMEKLTQERSGPNQTSLPPVRASGLPSLGGSGLPSLGPLRSAPPRNVDISKWETQKEEVEKKIDNFAQTQVPGSNNADTLKDRKARLLAQRQKLLEMKKVQRTEELKRYEEFKNSGVSGGEPIMAEVKEQTVEGKKRAEIYSMMKN
jgi:hypothetical protein